MGHSKSGVFVYCCHRGRIAAANGDAFASTAKLHIFSEMLNNN